MFDRMIEDLTMEDNKWVKTKKTFNSKDRINLNKFSSKNFFDLDDFNFEINELGDNSSKKNQTNNKFNTQKSNNNLPQKQEEERRDRRKSTKKKVGKQTNTSRSKSAPTRKPTPQSLAKIFDIKVSSENLKRNFENEKLFLTENDMKLNDNSDQVPIDIVQAKQSFILGGTKYLKFDKGDIITVLAKNKNGWWTGVLSGAKGKKKKKGKKIIERKKKLIFYYFKFFFFFINFPFS